MCKVSKQIPFHSKFSVCSRQFSQATSRSFSLQSLGHSVVRKLHHHLSFPAPTPCCPFLQTHVRKLMSESRCSGTPVAQQGCANRGHVPFLPFLRKITYLFLPKAAWFEPSIFKLWKRTCPPLAKWSNSITRRCANQLSEQLLLWPPSPSKLCSVWPKTQQLCWSSLKYWHRQSVNP